MSTVAPSAFAAGLAAATLLACTHTHDQGEAATLDGGTEEAGGGTSDSAADTTPNACTVGEMAAILAAVNQAQVDATMQLQATLSDPRAVNLADKMLTDHQLLLEQLQGEMRDANVSARDGGVSGDIAASAKQDLTAIAASSSVDSAYADREVLWHLRDQALLGTVITPALQGTRLTFVTTSMQEIEKQHMTLVLALQAELDGTCR